MSDDVKVVTTLRQRATRSVVPAHAGMPAAAQYDAAIATYTGAPCPVAADIRKEIDTKVRAYVAQDTRAGRPVPDALTVDAALEKLVAARGRCLYCRCRVRVFYAEVRDPTQWTLDRVDNDEPHRADNVVVSCLGCNLARRRTIHAKFLMAKRLKLEKTGHG